MQLNLRWAAGLVMAFLFASTQISFAQCDDSCPNNNLVTNGDFQAGNTGFTSGFPEDCTCQTYSWCVGAEPRDKCGNSDWVNDLWDHTLGNSNGRYLLVDGRTNTGQNANFWNNTVSVTSGTTYTYSFWLMPNISIGTDAEVQMTVNGANLGPVVSGTGTTWTYFCQTWTATTTGNITIGLNHVNPSGLIGDDFGVDDIFFGSCEDPCEVEARFDVQEKDCVFSFFDFSSPGNASTQIVGWQWKFGDGCSSNEQNPTHVFDQPGLYEVCLTVTALNPETGECCTSEICERIEVNCEPRECEIKGDFSFDVCDPCVYDFDGSIITANRNITGWFWDFGDGSTGVGQNVEHVFPGPGSYNVCLTIVALDREGRCCTDQVCQKVEVKCEGVQKQRSEATIEPLEDQSFKLFPNPMNEQTTITYDLNTTSKVHLAVRDIQGRVLKVLVNGEQGEGAYQIDLNAGKMPAGTYLVTFTSNDRSEVKRLVIQR